MGWNITISVDNCSNKRAKVLFFFTCIAVLIHIIISTRVFKKLMSFCQIAKQKLGTRKINGSRKFSEIKVQNPRVRMFLIDWNLARHIVCENVNKRMSRISFKCHKFKPNFDHSGRISTKLLQRQQTAKQEIHCIPNVYLKKCPLVRQVKLWSLPLQSYSHSSSNN